MTQYADFVFGANLIDIDPLLDQLIKLEEERQQRRIILIPSESYAPQPVRQALGSVFTNIYAEGYPPRQMVGNDEALLADMVKQLAYYRRYADRRFYKGADYVHFLETLAQRRAAACFANERARQDEIFVNVQPLSGGAANLAIYDALMSPGDTLMGMDLFQGGHLSHGSEFNVSGKRYHVVSYGIDKKTRQLNYDDMQKLVEETRPRVIVAGYTSYPWAPDFERLREIADRVGAYLVADISHPAGMAIAGVYPNPVGVADVVMFTTHKTLCGPRGACILTTERSLAAKIDMAVFPGMQGGPHTNKFAAMCVAFQIARSDSFRDLQRRIVENAQALAAGLTSRGIELAYGGTDTHLLLIDLKSVKPKNKQPLYGEVVARILELAGIVVNKNTVPWDNVTALATGIRMGTPWVTQRGMGTAEMDTLAECIARIVHGIVPFYYEGRSRHLPRGKIDLQTLEEVKWMVDNLTCGAKVEIDRARSEYPHYCLCPQCVDKPDKLYAPPGSPTIAVEADATLLDLSDSGVIAVSGWRAQQFLNELCSADIAALAVGQGTHSLMLDRDAQVLDDVVVWRMPRDERERDFYLVITHPECTDQIVAWMRGISDGYVLCDNEDVWRKVQGPVGVEVVSQRAPEQRIAMVALVGAQAGEKLRRALGAAWPAQLAEMGFAYLQLTDALAVTRRVYAGRVIWGVQGLVSQVRAIWEALIEDEAVPLPAAQVHDRYCAEVGLPAVGVREKNAAPYIKEYPYLFDLSKPYFVGQNALPAPEREGSRRSFTWAAPADAPLKRTPLYQEHARMGARLIPFAGWEMPVWYSSVGEEHRAVRETAGLFDVAHMGTLEISGAHAADLVDLVSSNYAHWLQDGQSQYATLIDADGRVLDDIMVYRRAWDRFFIVVNAANFDRDWAWLNAVNDNEVLIDRDRPWVRVRHPATLRDLHSPSSGDDQRVDVALQGPDSLRILLAWATDYPDLTDAGLVAKLERLRRTEFIEGKFAGLDLILARTGYTGEAMGFEIYVHPDRAATLWRMLLKYGDVFGLKPCGLAARDSTRIEAGLPLYGHELGGPLSVTPTEAGFAVYVKYHKPFFIGRTPYKRYNDASKRRIVRFQVVDKGARAIRGGEHGEPVVNKRGKVIGRVTSCALIGERQIGLALVDGRYVKPGTELLIYPEARRAVAKTPQAFEWGDTVALAINALVLSRFPGR